VLQERDGNNVPAVTYTRGRDLSGGLQGAGGIGGLLALTLHSSLPTPHFFYHADGNGNITCLLNEKQAVVARYVYEPFGNVLSLSGPLAEVNLYRFSSKEAHPITGLVYYGFRFYDPNLQRWMTRDPLGEMGGLNLYGFAQNTPVCLVDRLGLQPDLPPPFKYYSPGAGEYGDWIPGDDLTDCLIRAKERKALRDSSIRKHLGRKALGPVPVFGKGFRGCLIDKALEALHLAEFALGMGEGGERVKESKLVYQLDVWACNVCWGGNPVFPRLPAK